MLVWRVEHREQGLGPYRSDTPIADELCSAHGWKEKSRNFHPNPHEDNGIADKLYVKNAMVGVSRYYCGFVSLKQLREWFQGWLRRLHKAGFQIVVYKVDEHSVEVGQRQVVFYRDGARKLDEHGVLVRSDKIYV